MDAKIITGVIVGFIAVYAMAFFIPVGEADVPPPTPAWSTIEISNDPDFPIGDQINMTSANYRDKLYLVTDGSIILNITGVDP